MRDSFSTYHPLVNFIFFTLVIVFGMFFMHPICLLISLTSAVAYSVYLNGKRAVRFNLCYMLPLLFITALLNPAFNHEGITILTYLPSGNPLTLESILYGIAAAVMLISIICWFSCYNAVMTSDKFVYLFGRLIPALSLILSMVLRFVPKFKAQLKVVQNAQKSVGRDISNGRLLERIRHGIKILSIMVTWSLENAVDTADSMKSRGYGLKNRTAFSIYRFERRDLLALICLFAAGGYMLFGAISGGIYFTYFPAMQSINISVYSISIYFVYIILCNIPMILNITEGIKWKRIKSRA